MTWFALIAPRDALIYEELSAIGFPCERPMYTVSYWQPRKSVTVSRMYPLLPGYLLVGHDLLPLNATRHWCQLMLDHASGAPLRVHDGEGIIERAGLGEYDVSHKEPILENGSRVKITGLGLVGMIVQRIRREYLVRLDAGREVLVGQKGLVLA